jgi:hypothetical protein
VDFFIGSLDKTASRKSIQEVQDEGNTKVISQYGWE